MLEEPYRWVEAINNRRDYLQDQLAGGSPVVGTTYAGGVLLLTTTPGPRKLFEVYNEMAFAAVGHRADIEKLRKAVIDIAHIGEPCVSHASLCYAGCRGVGRPGVRVVDPAAATARTCYTLVLRESSAVILAGLECLVSLLRRAVV